MLHICIKLGHLEILASASRHRHWHRHQHRHSNTNVVFTQYKSPLELKVLYIFVKHVIVNKVATYRLGTCHFVRKCF